MLDPQGALDTEPSAATTRSSGAVAVVQARQPHSARVLGVLGVHSVELTKLDSVVSVVMKTQRVHIPTHYNELGPKSNSRYGISALIHQ